MKYDSVIFDMDGTLLDTLGNLRHAVNFVMQKYGFPKRTLTQVRSDVGNGVDYLIRHSVPKSANESVVLKAIEDYRAYYPLHSLEETFVFPGIDQLIDRLFYENVPLAIVSNKLDGAVKELTNVFFGNKISVAIGEKQSIRRKPYPDSVFEAIRLLKAKNPVYIGDSEVDIKTAENAQIDGIFVTWGFRTKEQLLLAGAKVTADSAEELYTML